MCTVSFVSINGNTIITSNRDEHIQREAADAPAIEIAGNPQDTKHKKIVFPKDAKAGGTWFAAASTGVVAVLLNGAFVKHTASPPYRKSRGLILLDIINADNALIFFNEMNLQEIEPFTVILYQPGFLHELRWDGNKKYTKSLNSSGNYIWSSATLYSDEVIEERKNKFDKFIHTEKNITPVSVHNFHNSNQGDHENGFIINRETGMKTFSVTQAIIKKELIDFIHTDLLQNQQYEKFLPLNL